MISLAQASKKNRIYIDYTNFKLEMCPCDSKTSRTLRVGAQLVFEPQKSRCF